MSRRSGFTLVELVVVVMILGILAAVAAPKLLETSGTATDNGVKQTLSVLRDAIERYAADNGSKPTASIATELLTYLRGSTFPNCPVGAKAGENGVKAAANSTVDSSTAWLYNTSTGEFLINSDATSNDDSTTYDEF